ncbi:MAG TPA: hypothetical protein VK357_03190 [Rubrobacteraceae bacterium]|nr:hypothetical protein [Rubrobacteraceae bacterium]
MSEFYRHAQMSDGRLNYCKDCKKAEMNNNRSLKRERYAEYERQRNQTEKRKAHPYANLKRWVRENPQKMVVQLARRRVRKLNAEGGFTVEEFEALCERYGNVCLRCGHEDFLLTPDHVVPLSYAAIATRGRISRLSTTSPTRCLLAGPNRLRRTG